MPILENPQHERFCQSYIKNGKNATQAYIDAGYSEVGANANASRLISNDSIKERLKELRIEVQAEDLITIDGLIEEMNEVKSTAKADNQLNIVAKILEMQGKMIAAFTDKKELTGKNGGAIETKAIQYEIVDTDKD